MALVYGYGVQHPEEAEPAAAKTLGRRGHIADRSCTGIEQGAVAGTLPTAQHRADPVRHSDCDQKMMHRHQPLGLFGQPGSRLIGTAARAVAITATSPVPVAATAVVTAISDSAEHSAATAHDRTDHLAMSQRNRFAELPQVCRCVLPEGIRNAGHVRSAAELIFADLGRRCAAELGELPDSAEVADVGAVAHACQVEVLGHSVVEFAAEVSGVEPGHRGFPC